jgi:DNA-binding NarL/FixJ family response regulator
MTRLDRVSDGTIAAAGGQAMSDQKVRVMSVDDHPMLREGIAAVINSASDMAMVAQAATGSEAVRAFRDHLPDVTLMDLRLPDMSGIDAMIAIREMAPDARILMFTTFEGDVEVQRALAAGARGYLLKSTPPEDLLQTVRLVHSGKKRVPPDIAAALAEHLSDESLTAREVEVLRHVGDGNRNRDVAERLSISEDTVKAHIKHIMEKLGASDRTQAVTIAVRRGIIQL